MEKPIRHYSTPMMDYEKYVNNKKGSTVWKEGNKRVLLAYLPDWLDKPEKDPPILAFMALHGRTYMGTFLSLEFAIGVLLHD